MRKLFFLLVATLFTSTSFSQGLISVTDGTLSDWDKLSPEYLSFCVCPVGTSYNGLLSLKAYADDMYLNLLVEYNPEVVTDLAWPGFHVYIDTDNSALTGGYGGQWTTAAFDVLLETAVFADGQLNPYNPSVFWWWGEVGANGWLCNDPSIEPSSENCYGAIVCGGSEPIGNSQLVGNTFEIQLNRELILTRPESPWGDVINIGIDIQQNWSSVGILPTEADDEYGRGKAAPMAIRVAPKGLGFVTYNASDSSAVILDGVTAVEDFPIFNSDSIVSITIPASVTSIAESAFANCTNLREIIVASENGVYSSLNGILYNKPQTDIIHVPRAIKGEVTLSSSLANINYSAFASRCFVTSISIPNSIKSIGDWAFDKCTSLTSITCEATTPPALGTDAFPSELTTAYIPCDTKEAYEASKWGTYSITSFIEEDCPEPIDPTWQITYTSTDGNIVKPNKTGVFGANIVSNEYKDGQGVITFDGPVTSIGEEAFNSRKSLTSITIPNSVTSIGGSAFSVCSSLTSITIPNSVTSIVNSAFVSCFSLISMVVESGNTTYDSRENCNAIIETATNTLIAGCQTTVIPNSVTSIGGRAFFNIDITTIIIPNSVTSIGESAFSYCTNLSSVTLGNNVKSIGEMAFYLTNFTSITIPNSVINIEKGAFCNTGLISLTIPNSITYIGEDVFAECYDLTSIIIPNSVTSIEKWAFYNCSSLDTIYLEATTPPTIESNTFTNTSASICHIPCGTKAAYEASDWASQVSEFIEEDCPEPIDPTWQITYTSTDGNIVTPNDVNVFGANIVNNEYKDGQGVITFDGPVTSIGSHAFFGCTSLTSITIPESVTSIGVNAFYHCTSLTSINIPESVTSIGFQAFAGCTSLTSITIPNSVKSIEGSAFFGCTSLTSINIPESVTSIGSTAFYACRSLTSITIPNSVTSIGSKAFSRCSSLTSMVVEPGNTTFDSRENCNAIIETATNTLIAGCQKTVIPNSVTSIGVYAFWDCTSFTSITIPNSVKTIEDHAFRECTSLTSINIPNSVTSIGSEAFDFCPSLTSITCEATTPPTLGSDVFPSELTTAYIPCGTKAAYEASDWASQVSEFIEEDCPEPIDPTWQITYTSTDGNIVTPYKTDVFGANIVSNEYKDGQGVITFDGPVTSIGDHAFSHCTSLTSITIPNIVTSIGWLAFSNCTSLASIIIPESVTSIFQNPFTSCNALTSIIVEAGNPRYDSRENCNAIIETETNALVAGCKSTIIPESVTSIEDNAFLDCNSLTSITIPSNVINIYMNPFASCDALTSIVVEAGNTTYDSRENCNAIIDKYTNTLIAGCKNTIIPNSVTSIGNSAFLYCSSLTSITIPNSVTSIGSNAFDGCFDLTTINIPEGITVIRSSTFSQCSLTLITLPKSITNIENGAFSNCQLVSITIPENVTNIGDHAFIGCYSLASITCKSTTPPTIGNEVFTSSFVCHIPCGTKAAYEASDWASYSITSFIEEECPEPIDPTWQITYTSSNDSIVTPYKTDVFGANIVSNNYQDGQGVITFDGPVTSIGDYAFWCCSSLTSIAIPNSVTSIGESAFHWCTSLTSITIPKSVKSIGMWAFSGCRSLTSVTIGSGVTSIGNAVFSDCHSLTSMVVEAGNPKYDSRENCNAIIEKATNTLIAGCKNTIIPSSVKSIGDWAFYGCYFLTSITIPNSVTSIGDWAFYGCYFLTSITIPNSVTSIGECAFSYCKKLNTMVVEEGNTTYDSRNNCNAIIEKATNTLIAGCKNTIIPNTVTSIGERAFYGCNSLTSITIPNSVTSIGNGAFDGCTSLTSITIPNTVKSIGNDAFAYCSSLTSITIPNSVTSIGEGAFGACTSLTSVTLGSSVTSIGDWAFVGCSSLTSITIPNSVTSIGDRAFRGCTSLASITIPNSVTSIGMWAFGACTSLTSITIPESVTSIGIWAFDDCPYLTSITCKATTPPTLGSEVFPSNLTTAYIPCGTKAAYEASKWGTYSITSFIEEDCPEPIDPTWQITYTSTDGNIVTPNDENVFGANIVNNEYKDGQGVITFDGPVTSIGSHALWDCTSLTSITIPQNVTNIGEYAFRACWSLETIYVEASTPPTLGNNAFEANSPTCYIPCGTLAAYEASDWAQYVSEFVEECPIPIVVKAKVPASWENDDITVWVWTDGAGTEYPTTKEGDWYVYTHSDNTAFNIIFKSGKGWKGNTYQTVDINGITENTCLEIQPTNIKATYTIVDCPSIIYELNSGITNDYDWMSKADMYHDLLVDINAIIPTTKVDVDTVTLAYSKTLSVGEGIPAWWTNLDPLLDDIHFMTKWGWLITYMDGVCVEQDAALQTIFRGSLFLKYHLAAFFIEDICPYGSVDYSIAGKDEAYIPAWKHGYANPTAPTDEFVLNMPYRECYTFDGWYADANFAGEQVLTVDSSFNGTLYAKWVENDCPIVNPVSWELEGGISPVELPTYITSTYVLPTPIRDGYVFMEWYHGNTLGIEIPMTILPIGYTGTLYAQWKKEPTDALNPFAYALSSELSQDNSQLLVNYSLNARAMDVQIVIMDGETAVKTIACDGLSKGSHSIAIPTAGLPEHKQLTWKVEVKGAEVTEPTEYAVNYSFYYPSAVDIDNNPENPTFGMILTNEGMHEVKDINGYLSTGYGAGIYAFNPAFEPMPNGSNPGYNGGIEFTNGRADDTTRIAHSPRRIRISEDGRIFVTSLNTDGNYLWEVNPENMNEWNSIFKGTLNGDKELVDAGGNFIAAPNCGFDVKGSGENLQLIMYSVNLPGITTAAMNGFRCDEYNLGTATEWTTAPSKNWVNGLYAINYTSTQVEYDNEGGIWIASYRGTASAANPGLVHINAEGVEDCKLLWSNVRQAGIRFNNDFTKLVVAGNNGSANKATIYAVSKDANGAPVLTEEWVIDATYILGKNLNDFAFDYAGNLYACGNSTKNGEKLVAWAMPRSADDIVTTPAASKYSFVISGGNATPRAWAYDLALVQEAEAYTFTFKATTAANATLIFTDVEGTELAAVELGAVEAGLNTKTLAANELPQGKKVNWAVKMAGEAITELAELTDASKGIYNFYLPQGVAVDNNPESATFGTIYVAEATDGASDGLSDRADTQKRGIFIYDQELNELNPTSNVGIIPSNVTLGVTTRQAMKRLAINPLTNEVAFAHNADPMAVWAVPAENVGGEAKNLIEGLGFASVNAICFTEDGTLYVLESNGYPAPGSLYKVVDGVVDTLFANYNRFGNGDNALVSDNRGGVWICQSRVELDIFNQLTHVNAAGEIDFEVNTTTPNGFGNMKTARGTIAYNPAEDILAMSIGTGSTIGASLYKVTYDEATGVPSLSFIAATPSFGRNVDGLAFDYAGDLYGLSANSERLYKFVVPTNNNVCTTPAASKYSFVISDGNNIITYTSTDGNIVTPYATDVFGANIVSNEYKDGQGVITFDGPIMNIGYMAFYQCSSLTSITIPNSVTSIGEYAFSYCSSLTSITIPDSITSIGDFAFLNCSSLTSINIPNSVESIGTHAFYWCESLTSLTIPNSVTSIGYVAFSGCSSLTSIVVEEGNPTYDSRDNCNAIIETATDILIVGCQNTIIPKIVTSIGDLAFLRCFSLTSLTIPNSVTVIGEGAFEDCSSLTSLTIPNSVTSIGDLAFCKCSSLTSITIPDSITSIGIWAFYRCSSLASITIPNSVTSIGDFAFKNCSSLNAIYVEATTPPILGFEVFTYTSPPICYIPCDTKAAYEASDWAQYVSEFVEEGCSPIQKCGDNLYWEYADGVLTITGTGEMYDFLAAIDAPWYDVCDSIISITMPEEITKIGDYAFGGCSLVGSITIPKSVKEIGRRAFEECTSLARIVFEGELPLHLLNSSRESFDSVFANVMADMEINKLNIEHGNELADLGANVSVENIVYKRKFMTGIWEALILPFEELVSMTMSYQGKEYNANYPWNSTNGGLFYLAEYSGNGEFATVNDLKTKTPYIIQFNNDIEITFTGLSYSQKRSDFKPSSESSEHILVGNITLQNQEMNSPIYYLGDDNNFKYTKTYTLKPFESYLTQIIETSSQINPKRMSVRLRPQNDVTTELPNVEVDQLSWHRNGNMLVIQAEGQPMNIYHINGALIQSFAEGQNEISIELTNGCYLINSAGFTEKIIF